MPRSRVPARNGGVLSPPKSSTRTVAVRPPSRASTGASARRCCASRRPRVRVEEARARCAAGRRPRRRRRAPASTSAPRRRRWPARVTALAVERLGRQRALRGGALARARRAAAAARAARRRCSASGASDHGAGVAVDDQRRAVARAPSTAVAERRRPSAARATARDDRGVRGRAAAGERDRRHAGAELGDVGRAEVVGDEHDASTAAPARRRLPPRREPRGRARPRLRTSSARAASISSGERGERVGLAPARREDRGGGAGSPSQHALPARPSTSAGVERHQRAGLDDLGLRRRARRRAVARRARRARAAAALERGEGALDLAPAARSGGPRSRATGRRRRARAPTPIAGAAATPAAPRRHRARPSALGGDRALAARA